MRSGATFTHERSFGNEGATMVSTGGRISVPDASIAGLPATRTSR